MALRPRVLARPVGRAQPPGPGNELTIEEARKQYALGSMELAVAEIKELKKLKAVAKEHGNTATRQETKVKGAIKSYSLAQELKPDDEVLIDDTAYSYNVTYSERIDVKGLYKMFKDKEITEAEFLMSISVSKADAERTIGQHRLMSITVPTPGKTLGVRTRALDAPVTQPQLRRAGHVEREVKLREVNIKPPVVKTSTSVGKLKPKRKLLR